MDNLSKPNQTLIQIGEVEGLCFDIGGLSGLRLRVSWWWVRSSSGFSSGLSELHLFSESQLRLVNLSVWSVNNSGSLSFDSSGSFLLLGFFLSSLDLSFVSSHLFFVTLLTNLFNTGLLGGFQLSSSFGNLSFSLSSDVRTLGFSKRLETRSNTGQSVSQGDVLFVLILGLGDGLGLEFVVSCQVTVLLRLGILGDDQSFTQQLLLLSVGWVDVLNRSVKGLSQVGQLGSDQLFDGGLRASLVDLTEWIVDESDNFSIVVDVEGQSTRGTCVQQEPFDFQRRQLKSTLESG
ncbi:hypothetical protein WICPIJ_003570 [Wickerhamomyces pijperi]|uniref:Uncharacterized protein n=1 Tax=Wickerhamomyces pijperi TaxID=599730 RepID=A0A9P8Q9C4_WICPI|nr:hypothetical protein WICPIJ_003570 [Wickerhamomyces pijperi]